MEKTNKLEQIFRKEGKFFDGKNKEVKPIQIGLGISFPRYPSLEIEKKLDELKMEKKEFNDVNTYLIGFEYTPVRTGFGIFQKSERIINFYKI